MTAASVNAQATDIKKVKGMQVVHRYALPIPKERRDGVWATEKDGSILFDDTSPADIIAFPLTDVCTVNGAGASTAKDLLVVRYKCGQQHRMIFVPKQPESALKAFNTIFAPVSEAAAVEELAFKRNSERVFSGKLANVPEERRRLLFKIARVRQVSLRFSADSIRGANYFGIHMMYPGVLNSARLNQNQRIAYVLNETLLTYTKTFASAVGDVQGLDGVAFHVSVPHRNFVSTVMGYETDRVVLYLSTASIRKFAAAEITGQDLLDEGIVMVNDNRMKIVLSDQG